MVNMVVVADEMGVPRDLFGQPCAYQQIDPGSTTSGSNHIRHVLV